MNKYEQIRVLGEGGYGKAILCKRKSDSNLFVIKEIRLSSLSPNDREEAMKEAEVLSSLHSPFIISYIESFQERGCFYIVMEYAEGGDLSQKIQSRGNKLYTEEEILKDFIQLALSIKYIHDRKILHRDLKAQNVFIAKDGTIKLGDFGIARVLEKTFQLCRTQIGSPYYLSPEICEGRSYNSKTDIWSLGCILYELCTLRHAFNAANMNGFLMNIVRGKYAPIPPTFSKELKQLISKLLTKDAKLRPSINAVLATPIIRSRLKAFYDETLNNKMNVKAQIYRPPVTRIGYNPQERNTNFDSLEVVPSCNNQMRNQSDFSEVESIILAKRENKKNNNRFSPERAVSVIYGDNINTNDSFMSRIDSKVPKWAKIPQSNHKNNDQFISKSNLSSPRIQKKVKQNLQFNYINQSPQPKRFVYNVDNNAYIKKSKSSLEYSSYKQASNKKGGDEMKKMRDNISEQKSVDALSQFNSSRVARRAQSKLGSQINEDEFQKIFGMQKNDNTTKKLLELESRQRRLEKPVLPFIDDINRRKLQLQRAEIENKRARMRQLQMNDKNDQKLIDEITRELDNDPILKAVEQSVNERCGPPINQNTNRKYNNKERLLVGSKSPQQAINNAHYHYQSVQSLADSIRDALLLNEEDCNDTSFAGISDNRNYSVETLNHDTGRFYLNGKELQFPVVNDNDSLSYRVEAIRAFLERELGLEKLLQIREMFISSEKDPDDPIFDDIEPGLVILTQQLVILDDMILSN